MLHNRRTIRTLLHCFYNLKYHIVWTPKYRGKVLVGPKVKQELRRILEMLCKWKHWEILELNVQDDHIHLVLLATPRDSISYVMQILKGKSSIFLARGIGALRADGVVLVTIYLVFTKKFLPRRRFSLRAFRLFLEIFNLVRASMRGIFSKSSRALSLSVVWVA